MNNKQDFLVDDVDDVRIGYNPAIQLQPGVKSHKSLHLDFYTSNGWVRLTLQDDVCDLFNRYYREQVLGRLE